jgi:hypothetical protein
MRQNEEFKVAQGPKLMEGQKLRWIYFSLEEVAHQMADAIHKRIPEPLIRPEMSAA